MNASVTPAAGRPAGMAALDYLELQLLWADGGPVALLRLRNRSAAGTVERVRVFARHAGRQQQIGEAVVRVKPGATVEAQVQLDRDFPAAGAWLQQEQARRPVRVWAGPDADWPRLEATATP